MEHMIVQDSGLSVRCLCALAGVSRSWWYSRRHGCGRAPGDGELVQRIQAVITEHRSYGYRRVTAVLRQEGMTINHKRVQRVMQQHRLGMRRTKRRTGTTRTDALARYAPNRIRQFAPTGPNQVWVADVTSLPLPRGAAYLACVLDAWSRRCLGWAVSRHQTADVTVAALDQAIAQRQPPLGLIHHSDRGSTYTSLTYQARLAEIGALCSMSATGEPTENAIIESFFKTLKYEEVISSDYTTMTELESMLAQFIDGYYNPSRLHSSLHYQAPQAFEAANTADGKSEL
jgi:putative transposase